MRGVGSGRGGRGARRAAAAVATLALAVAVCGQAAAGGSTYPRRSRPLALLAQSPPVVSNRSIAQADAAHLMALVKLPAGATGLTRHWPTGTPTILREPSSVPGTPYLALRTRFSVVPGSPTAVVAWLAAHVPTGSAARMSGSTTGPEGDTYDEGFAWPATEVLDERWLLATAASLTSSSSVVRFDAEVVYTPNRPPAEEIPPGVGRVELAITLSPTRKPTFTVTSPSAIARLETAIDSLSRPDYTVNPGGPCLCGPGADQSFVARFFVGEDRRPAVVVTDWPLLAEMGTGNVTFTLGTKREPILEDSRWLLAKAVERVTGVRLAAVPGQPGK